jgi:hypothetical protein
MPPAPRRRCPSCPHKHGGGPARRASDRRCVRRRFLYSLRCAHRHRHRHTQREREGDRRGKRGTEGIPALALIRPWRRWGRSRRPAPSWPRAPCSRAPPAYPPPRPSVGAGRPSRQSVPPPTHTHARSGCHAREGAPIAHAIQGPAGRVCLCLCRCLTEGWAATCLGVILGLDGALDAEHFAKGVFIAVLDLKVVPGLPVARLRLCGVGPKRDAHRERPRGREGGVVSHYTRPGTSDDQLTIHT